MVKTIKGGGYCLRNFSLATLPPPPLTDILKPRQNTNKHILPKICQNTSRPQSVMMFVPILKCKLSQYQAPLLAVGEAIISCIIHIKECIKKCIIYSNNFIYTDKKMGKFSVWTFVLCSFVIIFFRVSFINENEYFLL